MKFVIAAGVSIALGVVGVWATFFLLEWDEIKSLAYVLSGMFIGAGGMLLAVALAVQAFIASQATKE